MASTPSAPLAAPLGSQDARRRARRNQNGQAMGPKGLKTRRRLIDATVELLETVPLRELRVAEIARSAGTSPATFYLYFNDVSDVVLAALAELSQSTPELMRIAQGDWSRDHAFATARVLVAAYIEFWQSHATLFRIRNLTAEEGDERFRDGRAASIRPLLEAISAQVGRAQQAGIATPVPLHSESTAGVLLAMLERLAAVAPTHAGESDITPDRMMDAAAHLIASTLGH